MTERDLETNPYTADEQRVCDYLVSLMDIGCGEDPIGFLIASHNYLVECSKSSRKEVDAKIAAALGLDPTK